MVPPAGGVQLVEMALLDAQRRGGVDDLDIDRGQRLPEGARGVRQHQVTRLAVHGDDGDLGRPCLDDGEILLGEVRLGLGEQQRLLGRDLGAQDLHHLDGELAQGIELDEPARLEQAHEAAVAAQEGALVILDDGGGPKAQAGHGKLRKRGWQSNL